MPLDVTLGYPMNQMVCSQDSQMPDVSGFEMPENLGAHRDRALPTLTGQCHVHVTTLVRI